MHPVTLSQYIQSVQYWRLFRVQTHAVALTVDRNGIVRRGHR